MNQDFRIVLFWVFFVVVVQSRIGYIVKFHTFIVMYKMKTRLLWDSFMMCIYLIFDESTYEKRGK